MKILISLLFVLPLMILAGYNTPDVQITYRRMVNAGEYVKFSLVNVSGNAEKFDARFILKDAAGETVFTSPWSSFFGKEQHGAYFWCDTLPWAYTDHLNCELEIRQNGRITRYDGLLPIQVEVAVNYNPGMFRQATSLIGKATLKRNFDENGKMNISVAAQSPILKVEGVCNGQAVLTMPGNGRKQFSFEVPPELTFPVRNFKVTLADGKTWCSRMFPFPMTRDIRRVRVWHEKTGRPVWVMCSGSRLRTLPFKRQAAFGSLDFAKNTVSGLTAFTFQVDVLQRNSAGVQKIAECKGVFRILSDNGKIVLIVRKPGDKHFWRCDSGLTLTPGKKMRLEWYYNFNDQRLGIDGKEVECKFVQLDKKNQFPAKISNFDGTVSGYSIRYGR